MKAIEVKQPIMAGLVDSSIELFANGFKLLFSKSGKIEEGIKNLPINVYRAIQKQMHANKEAMSILNNWCKDEEEKVEQYAFCNYGGINIVPDFNSDTNSLNCEPWACPKRGQCEGEGKVCISISEKRLSNMENKVLQQIVRHPSQPYKRVAYDLGISVNTLGKHTTSIYRKVGINSKPELISRAMTINSIL